MSIEFKKAVKVGSKLKVAITGPSGAGKTFGALGLAQGLGRKIAFVDTECGSASLYADKFEFDVIDMNPPYITQKYIDAINAAVEAKYDVLVIDSISHMWAAEGGILDRKTARDVAGGNSYTNWAMFTKEHETFKALLIKAPIHIICTMRSKQDYVMELTSSGKSAPKKVGLAPIQREGMEYEFTIVFDVGIDHNSSVSKDRTGLYDGQYFKLNKAVGQQLKEWLGNGKEDKSNKNATK